MPFNLIRFVPFVIFLLNEKRKFCSLACALAAGGAGLSLTLGASVIFAAPTATAPTAPTIMEPTAPTVAAPVSPPPKVAPTPPTAILPPVSGTTATVTPSTITTSTTSSTTTSTRAVVATSSTSTTSTTSTSVTTLTPKAADAPPILPPSAPGQTFDFRSLRQTVEAGRLDDAIANIQHALTQSPNSDTRGLLLFQLGILQFAKGKYDESRASYLGALKANVRIDDHVHYQLAQTELAAGHKEDARKQLLMASQNTPNQELATRARLEMAAIALDMKVWTDAARLLQPMEKKNRSREFYPEILYGLLRIELHGKRRYNVCKWARKLYRMYPDYTALKTWNLDLQNAKVDGITLSCIASPDDQHQRLRSLQFAGEFEEAKREINLLLSRTTTDTRFPIDSILANFYIDDGYIDDAMKVLTPYEKSEVSNFKYVSLIAKAAVRMGDFQVAVSQYEKAYHLNSRSKAGKSALQIAANLSFMSQDYDGAIRRYENIKKVFGGSGIGREADWFIAFAHYMTGDYDDALKLFVHMKPVRARSRRRARPESVVSQDRIRYWTAMTLYKLNRIKEARAVFQGLAADRGLGYYALAAQSRLNTVTEDATPSLQAVQPHLSSDELKSLGAQFPGHPASARLKNTLQLPTTPGQAIAAETRDDEETPDSDGNPSVSEEPTAQQDVADIADDENKTDDADSADSSEPSSFAASLMAGAARLTEALKDPRLLLRFQRANDLLSVGLSDWVRPELGEIERRTLNKDYLKRVMDEYAQVGNFNRSSIIADLVFHDQRVKNGFKNGGRTLWEHAYPQAFKLWVAKFSGAYNVPSEFVWSIMRQESQYRVEAKSGVGAMGLMQVMPFTAVTVEKQLGMKEILASNLLHPDTNIQVGSRYLGKLYQQFEGRVALAAAAYNAGPHRVEAWIKYLGKLETDEFVEHIPFAQTRTYVKKVTQNFAIYSALYGKNPDALVKAPTWLTQEVGLELSHPVSPREVW